MVLSWLKRADPEYLLRIAVVLLPSSVASQPRPLDFVEVDAGTISCMFSKKCKVFAHETAGAITLPSGVSGKAWLRSRTFRGSRGSPAAGKRGYQYQVDLTQATSLSETPCVTDLAVDFGEVIPMKYGSAGSGNHVYVIAHGESRSVGLFAAEADGNVVTFTFNEPVCAGINADTGVASYFVGVTAVHRPKSVVAYVRLPGQRVTRVKARAPNY